MRYKVCGRFGVLMSEGSESISGGLPVEIDAAGLVTLTRGDGKQYVTETQGNFLVPSAFLINGRYSFTVGDIKCAAFRVFNGCAARCVDSTYEEIANMWVAVAEILERAEDAEEKANEAKETVEEFRTGYRTE